MTVPPSDRHLGRTLGRYRLDRRIGAGGMGEVYAATDLRLGRTVAVKLLTGSLARTPEFLARFEDEATIMAALDSPYVVRLIDHDVDRGEDGAGGAGGDGLPYLVTQYVDGTDLGEHLRTHGALPVLDALRLCSQVSRGLADAHQRGVLHRDLKLGNVLVQRPGTPQQHAYLCDFGIARAAHLPHRTRAGVVLGSPSTMAPELADGTPASVASDLYALGCVLWCCLTGRPPYAGTEAEVAIAHRQAPVPQLPTDGTTGTAPPAVLDGTNALLAQLLAKDPAARPAGARVVREELDRLAALAVGSEPAPPAPVAPPITPPPPGPPSSLEPTVARGTPLPAGPQPGQRDRRGRRGLVVAAAATAAVVVAGTGVALSLADRDAGTDAPTADGTAGTTASPLPPVTGDLDGDGFGDLTVLRLSADGQPVARWDLTSDGTRLVDPAGAPGTAVTAPTPRGDGFGRLALGDVDGDGRYDEVWTTWSAPDVAVVDVLTAEGDTWSATWTGAWSNRDRPLLADLDGDGRDDLLFIEEYPVDGDTYAVDVARAGDDGFADPERWFESSDVGMFATHLADIDDDGRVDLSVDLQRSVGDTSFTEHLLIRSTGEQLELALTQDGADVPAAAGTAFQGTADLDGDGRDELVHVGGAGLSVVRFDAEGRAQPPEALWQAPADRAAEWRDRAFDHGSRYRWADLWAVSDVDGDGDDDVVFLRPDAGGAVVEVYAAEDGVLTGPTTWATIPCSQAGAGQACVDEFQVVTSKEGH